MGIEEIMLFPTIWLYMLGGAMASQKRNHITCGILTLYIKKDLSMQIFNVVKCFISFTVSAWLTYWAFSYFVYSFKTWKYSDLVGIPMFLGESAIFLGLLFMTMYAGSDLYHDVKILLKGRKLAGEGEK
jgi:TRAP-type C4-dicarboxylate transport system permease small subunit